LVATTAAFGVWAPAAHAGYYVNEGPFSESDLEAACGDPEGAAIYAMENSDFVPAAPFYMWTEDGGTLQCDAASLASQEQMDDLQSSMAAAADEATGTTVPSDIPAADAAEGTGLWDSLSGAVNTLKTSAMDWLGTVGEWGGWSALPLTLSSVASVGVAGYLGIKLGGFIDSVFGLDEDSSSPVSTWPQVTHYEPVPNGENLSTWVNSDTAGFAGSSIAVAGASTAFGGGTGSVGSDMLMGAITGNAGSVLSVSPGTPNATGGTPACTGAIGVSRTGVPPTVNAAELSGNPTGPTGSGIGSGGTWVMTVRSISASGTYTGCEIDTYVWLVPAEWSTLPGPGQGQDAPQQNTLSPTALSPTESAVRTASASCLQSASYPCGTAGGMNDQLCGYDEAHGQSTCGDAVTQPGVATITIPAPNSDETYSHYVGRLQAAGFLGTIKDVVLTADEADPATAPDDVVSTVPVAGTAVAPSTAIDVQTNPDTGAPSSSPSGVTPPAAPGISVPSAGTPCTVFPFGIPCWIATQLGSLSSGAAAPDFTIGCPSFFGSCGLHVDLSTIFGFDMNGFMEIFSQVLIALSFAGLIYWLGGMALGGSTSGGGNDDD
jgi:hypothetical protein